MEKNLTAEYQLVPAEKGSCYRFFCAVTGAALCTQEAYRAEDPEQELLLAWEREGRGQFNQCRKCGRWVFDVAYNPEVLECIACAPFECEARYCKSCGVRVPAGSRICPACGRTLYYEGVDSHDAEAQV